MNLKRIRAMAGKEIIQIKRDARSIAIVIAMPLVMMLAFGYGVSFDSKHMPLYVYDMDGSPQSRDLLARFAATPYFKVVTAVHDYSHLVQALDSGVCQLALVIPANFSRALNSGGSVSIQLLTDGTDSNSANLGMSYCQAIVQSYSQQI